MRRSTISFLLLPLLSAACGDASVSPTRAGLSARTTSDIRLRTAATELARAVALQLRDARLRDNLFQALQESPFREGKVSWTAFAGGPGHALRERIAGDPVGHAANRRLLEAFRDLEVYVPVPEHRAQWKGGAELVVTVYLDDVYGREGWVGFDLQGNEVKLSLDGPPARPVLVLLRPEGLIRRGQVVGFAKACPEETCGGDDGGGGGGSEPPPLPAGYFMLDWQIDGSYEGWTAGSPEFELVAWHWTGQWAYNSYGGRIPILADEFFSCTSGDYGSTDPRDWYYNSPPEKHHAWEYGSSGIQVLNAMEANSFPGRPGIPVLMVTENDDTPCIEGEFPTAWDPSFPANNDEFVGSIRLDALTTASNVPFYGDEYNPGLHAIMSFVRRF